MRLWPDEAMAACTSLGQSASHLGEGTVPPNITEKSCEVNVAGGWWKECHSPQWCSHWRTDCAPVSKSPRVLIWATVSILSGSRAQKAMKVENLLGGWDRTIFIIYMNENIKDWKMALNRLSSRAHMKSQQIREKVLEVLDTEKCPRKPQWDTCHICQDGHS